MNKICFFLLLFNAFAFSDFDDILRRSEFEWNEMRKITSKPSLDLLIENFYDFGVGHQNAVGPFTAPDQEAYSLLGEDYRWTRFYDQGFNITDKFFSGSSLHKLELNEQDVWIDPLEARIFVKNQTNRRQLMGIDLGTGKLGNESLSQGSRIYDFVMNKMLPVGGAGQPIDRHSDTPTSRKKNRYHIESVNNFFFEKENGTFFFKNLNQFGQRKFNTFDNRTVDGHYDEGYARVQLSMDWLPKEMPTAFGVRSVSARYTHLSRDNLFAEKYYGKAETATLDSDALSLWSDLKMGDIDWTPGISIARKKIQHNTPNFSRNLVDQDGSGFTPWYASADVLEISFNNQLSWSPEIPWLTHSEVTVDWENSVLAHISEQESHHDIYFEHRSESNAYTNQSLYRLELKNNPFAFYMGHLSADFKVEKKFFKKYLHTRLSGGLVLDTVFLKDRSIALPDWEYTADVDFVKTKNVRFSFNVGQRSIPITSELPMFMSKDYINGKYYFWTNDLDSDGVSDPGEYSGTYRTTGGSYHEYADNLRHPNYFYMDIPLDVKIGKHVAISQTVSYKLFKHLFKVRFKNDNGSTVGVTTGGNGEREGTGTDERAYVFGGRETRYVLGNQDDVTFPEAPNFLFKKPFYAGAMWKLAVSTEHVYFSAAWKAYVIMGENKYGNGFHENNLGTISEEDANPNTKIHKNGRMRQDKGYIGKLHLAFSPRVKNLWTSFSLKYRDGTPIAHYEYHIHNDVNGYQASIWNQGINGDNPWTGEFGQREDSLWNLDWDISYSWQGKKYGGFVYFQIYNLLDLGNELVEMTFRDNRRALETEQPRGFRTGIHFYF